MRWLGGLLVVCGLIVHGVAAASTGEDDEDAADVIALPPKEVADLWLTKSVAQQGPVVPGQEVRFVITVGNRGPGVARQVETVDQLPQGLQFVAAQVSAGVLKSTPTQPGARVGPWLLAELAAGETATMSVRTRVLPSGGYVNLAEIHQAWADDPNSVPGNLSPGEDDIGSATLTVVPAGDMPQVPTLSEWAMILLVLSFLVLGQPALRERLLRLRR